MFPAIVLSIDIASSMLVFLVLTYIQVILELFTLILIINTGNNIGKSYPLVKHYHD
jgi:hypothetical protein